MDDDDRSMSNSCRLCGELRDVIPNAGCENPLQTFVLRYIGVQIRENDTLPKGVCKVCQENVYAFNAYVERCLNIQIQLTKYINGKQFSIKIESEDAEIHPEENIFETVNIKLEKLTNNDDCSINYDNITKSGDYDQCNNLAPKLKLKSKKKIKDLTSSDDIDSKIIPKKNKIQDAIISEKSINQNDLSTFSCNQCDQVTKTLEALTKHKMRHLFKEKRRYQCASCEKSFKTKTGLVKHIKVHMPLKERYMYPCSMCDKKFTVKSTANTHMKYVHEKIKMFTCDICGYSCSNKGNLLPHCATHNEEKSFECNICYKRFKTHSNLKRHVDTHPETSYPCTICGRVLNTKRTWQKHKLVHQDKYEHKCTYCNKLFKRRSNLKVHLITHTGSKPFKCPWCPKSFSYNTTLKQHKYKIHFDQLTELKKEIENFTKPCVD